MSETIAEMVLPGTYIEVRSEGLIGVGAIATGNLGIVGTAARGAKGRVVVLGSMAEALDAFGPADSALTPTTADTPLTLARGLELAFAGGASSVRAVRIANGTPAPATLGVRAAGDQDAFLLTAGPARERPAGEADPDAGSWGNGLTVSVEQEGTAWKLTVEGSGAKEVFSGANVGEVHAALAGSRLVRAGDVSNGGAAFDPLAATPLAGGSDGAGATVNDVADGLGALEDSDVNLLVVPGFGASTVAGAVGAHLERTENDARERIAVLGVSSPGTTTDTSAPVDEAEGVANPRIVLVAPGLAVTDRATGRPVTLAPSYLAAVVAGRLATVAPHVSLTNKTLPVDGLDVAYSSAAAKNLLQNRILVVRRRFGFQVVKAISTDAGAFRQISVRRTVDFAKSGVRSGADPYIGKLNNARVRAALKATLDGFLSDMVLNEMLVAYELDVSATRAQEINGICAVTMTLQPTFSIDFIRVTMNLQ
jgi:hypothetical protein